jgi:SAM-dependent methyltransferase
VIVSTVEEGFEPACHRETGGWLSDVIVGQFRRPHGMLGSLAGWIMANRASNIDRNHWTVELMGLDAGARILEIGCGPGIGIEAVLSGVPDCRVTGLDHSALMISQAAARHAHALKSDRLELWQGDLVGLPEAERFDAVFSSNVLQFIRNRSALLEEVQSRLKPGGCFATTFRPRGSCAGAEEGRAWISSFAEDLCVAGFFEVQIRERPFGSVPAFCALAQNP